MTSPNEKLVDLVSRLPLVDSRPSFSVLHETYTDADFALSITPANLLNVLHKAREARDLAVSYRDFKVGAAIFSMKRSPAETQILVGANVKPEPESTINIHAEQLAMRRATALGYNAISIVGVVGETQEDQQSGHVMSTLHPCGLCRTALGSSSLVSRNRTLVATALPDLRTIELSTVNRLDLYHDKAQFHHTTHVELGDLELFHPVATGAPIEIHDSDEMIANDRAWTEAIDPYLLPFRLPAAEEDAA